MATLEDVICIVNGAREQGPIGTKAAMALPHWAEVVRILEPAATDAEVQEALDDHVRRGLMAFERDMEITTIGGRKIRIDGYYRSAP